MADGATEGDQGIADRDEDPVPAARRQAFVEGAHRIWAGTDCADVAGAAQVKTVGKFERGGQLYTVGLGGPRQPKKLRRPVVVHAGDTVQDRGFAAGFADVVTTGPADISGALALRRDLAARTVDAGRGANDVRIFQAATFILAPTQIQAFAKADWMRARLPESAWDEWAFIGSYAGVAGMLQDFSRSGAVDGFTIMPWLFPDELSGIVNHLVPALQALGIYPEGHAASTLRGNLGLPDGRPHQKHQTGHARQSSRSTIWAMSILTWICA